MAMAQAGHPGGSTALLLLPPAPAWGAVRACGPRGRPGLGHRPRTLSWPWERLPQPARGTRGMRHQRTRLPCPSQKRELESAGLTQPPLTKILQYFPAITALERISRIILNSRKGISQGNGRGSCLLFPLIAQGHLHTQGHLPALSFLGLVAAAPSNNVPVTINPFMSPFLPGIAEQFFFSFFLSPLLLIFVSCPLGIVYLTKHQTQSLTARGH